MGGGRIRISTNPYLYKPLGLLLLYEGQYLNTTTKTIPEQSHFWQQTWFYILIGFIVLLIVIIILLFLYYLYHRNMKKTNKRLEFMFSFIKKQNQVNSTDMEMTDVLCIEKERLLIYYERSVGAGICSTVFRGFLSGLAPLAKSVNLIETQKFFDCEVAVKVALNVENEEVEQLFKEIEVMKTLQYNRNVISMLGWLMISGKPALIYELAEQNLLTFVKRLRLKDKKEISYKALLSVIWQISKGMEFIASKAVIHRDLAARNVLLTNDLRAKISDFGLAVINADENKETILPKKLPVRWLSIEAIMEKLFSEKSDVWAFGVLMFEVFSMGQDPYAEIPTGQLLKFLRNGSRMQRPELATNKIYELMCRCWEEDMEIRPKFEELAVELHVVLDQEAGNSKYYEELELLQKVDKNSENNSDPY
jgi:serine/threonine protein kinase